MAWNGESSSPRRARDKVRTEYPAKETSASATLRREAVLPRASRSAGSADSKARRLSSRSARRSMSRSS